jgi:hypothetical protein
MMKPIAAHTVKMRLRKSSSGRIGSLARDSAKTNAVSSTIERVMSRNVSSELHANVDPPRLVKSTMHVSPPASSAAPR